jgi:predicted amidohydrolase YtcJ
VHVVGDKGLDIVLDAYRKANEDQSIVGKRWTIEHGHVTSPDQFDRIKSLGVIISSQFHTYMAGRTMVQNWGKERGGSSFRTREWLNAGLKVGAGTDWTLTPPNPFEVLYFLVTRTNRYGDVMGPEQRVSRQEALKLVTIDNAYITFEEDTKGSIEAGKLADFVVLDRDYLAVPDAEIRQIKPEMTVVGGKVVFDAARPTSQ